MSETVLHKRRALGRGLAALIPGGTAVTSEGPDFRPPIPAAVPATGSAPTPATAPARRDYFLAPIEDIHPASNQPRKLFDDGRLDELAQSIREAGIIEPLIVRERRGADGGFVLIAGERRWRAAQRAGLREVPVVVREASENQAFELALVENVQRADLNPMEEAEAYHHLAEAGGYTQEQIAERVGKDRTTVTNALRLLKLPASVRALVSDGSLSMGHARALLGLEDPERIEIAARKVVARGLSVRATEELVRKERESAAGATEPAPAAPVKSAAVRDLEQRLTRSLGARVKVADKGGGKGGKIEIEYSDLDDLDRLLERLLAMARN